MSQLLFEKAELSFAAYAILEPGMVGRDLEDRLKGAGFSETQARRFAERYRVVDQYTNEENGLSVTFFERLSGSPPEQIIAIRGTEFGTDFINDVVIADVLGIGTSPDGRDLAQYSSLRWAVDTWLGGSWLRPGYSIAGHSLGGYLGGVLAGDPLARANQAYLYNAPGTMGLLGPLTEAITSRFGLSSWNAPNATEIEGSAGLSLIAGIGQDFSGNKVIAEIESQTNPFNNHSIVVLTDALAVYALYSELAPALTAAQITQLLKSASATNKGTLEAALDALRKNLLGANATATAEENRESLYRNLKALQDSAEYKVLKGDAAVRLTATQDAATLVARAKSDFGHFLAVKYLLPVAIEGSWGVLNGDDNYIANSTGLVNIIGLDIPENFLAFRTYDWSVTVGDDPFDTRYAHVQSLDTAALVGGADVIFGGDGDDLLTGENNGRRDASGNPLPDPGDDFIDGGAGDDFLDGGALAAGESQSPQDGGQPSANDPVWRKAA